MVISGQEEDLFFELPLLWTVVMDRIFHRPALIPRQLLPLAELSCIDLDPSGLKKRLWRSQ